MSQDVSNDLEKQAAVEAAIRNLTAVFYNTFLETLAERGYPIANEKQAENLINLALALEQEVKQAMDKSAGIDPYEYVTSSVLNEDYMNKQAADVLNDVYTRADALMAYEPNLFNSAAIIAALKSAYQGG